MEKINGFNAAAEALIRFEENLLIDDSEEYTRDSIEFERSELAELWSKFKKSYEVLWGMSPKMKTGKESKKFMRNSR